MRYALLERKPSAAKKLTSGMSRTPSLGMPVTPVCQVGFCHPSLVRGIDPLEEPVLLVEAAQLATVDPSLTTQPLAPPLPPMVSTR